MHKEKRQLALLAGHAGRMVQEEGKKKEKMTPTLEGAEAARDTEEQSGKTRRKKSYGKERQRARRLAAEADRQLVPQYRNTVEKVDRVVGTFAERSYYKGWH